MTEKPSIDPADENDLTGALRHILKKEMQRTDGMLPAKIVAFDRATNRATVQPMIMLLTTSDTKIQRATIASVPVYQIGGGGFILNFNLNPGDLGWIKASDRDISLFLDSYKESAPNTVRTHNFSDSVFYPDVMTGYSIAGEDAENAVLQNLDGSVKVSLSQTSINIVASSQVNVTAPNVNVDGVTEITGDTTINGTITLNGAVTATQTLSVSGAMTNDGTDVGNTHSHPQGNDSAGDTQQNTGTPV